MRPTISKPTFSRLTVLSDALKKSARKENDLRPAQIAAAIDKELRRVAVEPKAS